MRLLIVADLAARAAIVTSFVLKKIDGPWQEDNALRTGVVGAVSAVVGMSVARSTRKKD